MVLSLVIPTYNEAHGLRTLIDSIHVALSKSAVSYEIIVVDDNSPDGTADEAENLAILGFPVRVLRRAGKLGLSSAVLDGWSEAQGEILAVMDADGSHDATILPDMLRSLTEGISEVAVGSRYVSGGGIVNWPFHRRAISRIAVLLGSLVCPVKDLTSGFLMFRRSVIDGVFLDPIGFKIGLEVLVRGRYQRFLEVPYTFKDRTEGQSKLGAKQVVQYIIQLWRLIWAYREKPEKPLPAEVASSSNSKRSSE